MATDKPRVTAYIEPRNSERLKKFCRKMKMSESQAIDWILSEYFDDEVPPCIGDVPANTSITPSITLEQIEPLVEEKVEQRTRTVIDNFNELLEQLQNRLKEVEQRLGESKASEKKTRGLRKVSHYLGEVTHLKKNS